MAIAMRESFVEERSYRNDAPEPHRKYDLMNNTFNILSIW